MDRSDTDPERRSAENAVAAASLYDVYYFAHGCGRPYVRDEGWLGFFGEIASRIVSELNPATVLDAGCALGFLVEGLRGRGVDARGLDVSEYAIGQVHEDIRPFCRRGSVIEPLTERYDLIVCIEVLEHLSAGDAERVVENFASATDEVLFSSTPIDYKEVTHFNVRQPEYWAELFARHGMYRDLDFDASFITPWATLYRRHRQSPPRIVAGYERRLWNLTKELNGCRDLALEQRSQLGGRDADVEFLRARLTELDTMVQGRAEAERRLAEQVAAARVAQRERAEYAEALLAAERERAESYQVTQGALAQAALASAETQRLAEQLADREHVLAAVTASGTWALAKKAQRVRRMLAPTGTRRHHAVRLAVQAARVWKHEGSLAVVRKSRRRLLGHQPPANAVPAATPAAPDRVAARALAEGEYAEWIARTEPDAIALDAQSTAALALGFQPLVSILTPVHDTPPEILEATIRSVIEQTYARWELCLVDGGSADPATRAVLDSWARRDTRVRVRRLEQNLGIAGNSNAALEMAQGEYVALLDHDDLLAPSALYEVARRLDAEPMLDFLYSDKDRISEDGSRRFCPFFKPGWAPEIMLSANYLTHLCVIRTSVARHVGGFRAETEGAQDWDFFLRVLEQTDRIAHIPGVLYHWRVWNRSVAAGMSAKPYAFESQRRTLEDYLARNGQKGEVAFDPHGIIRVRWPDSPRPAVSIVLVAAGSSGHLPRVLQSLGERTDYSRFEIIIVHCGPKPPGLRDYYEDLAADSRIRVVKQEGASDSFAARNQGARHASGELLLFLSESLEPLSTDWLCELVQWSTRPGIGIVGAKILRADGRVEHAGQVAGLCGAFGSVFAGIEERQGNIFGDVEWYRNYLAVSGDCLLVRRELFEDLGGFDVEFARYGADVDLCLRGLERGLRVVYTPFCRLKRAGASPTMAGVSEIGLQRLHKRCRGILAAGDPYYNPNLSLAFPIPQPAAADERPSVRSMQTWTLARLKDSREGELTVPVARPRDPYCEQAGHLVAWLDFTPLERDASVQVHKSHPGPLDIRSINWFIPEFQNAFYGGVYTILRFASFLKRRKGVMNRFYFIGGGEEARLRSAMARAFPNLHGEQIQLLGSDQDLAHLEFADASVATLWTTAYYALKFNRTRRKFYFMQDCEPLFYPAGSTSGLVEATYRFGFHGIANTVALKEIYEREYGGTAEYFTPCVDTDLFYPRHDRSSGSDGVFRIFFYGRPHSVRNGFELGTAALRRLKRRLGGRVSILAAGDDWDPADHGLQGVVENLGLLNFEETAALYRTCDIGLVLMFTRHPSYLPFEFMASGCLVVTNRNPATGWLLKDGENCLLAEPSVGCIAEVLERGLADGRGRDRITSNALKLVRDAHSDWGAEIERIFDYMCDPNGRQGGADIRPLSRNEEPIRATG